MNDIGPPIEAETMALEALQPDAIAEAPTVVEQLTRGEVDMQVATAKRWPRSIQFFKQQAMALAVKSPEVARACFYILPRGGKKIEGPSIRLAEIVATSWTNLRCEARVLQVGDTMLTAQATCWDMQTNVLVRREVQRRITDKHGRRYQDDMVVVTGNAACSIALRNAIFSVVPRAYVDDIYQHCRRVAAGQRGSLDDARKKWLDWYAKRDVTKAQLLDLLDKPGIDDIDIDDITTLQGLATALAEGETTLEELFGPAEAKDKNGVKKFGFAARQAKTEVAQQDAQPDEPDKPAAADQPAQKAAGKDAAKPQKK